MSKSNKEQRARLERALASDYIDAFNNSRSGDEEDVAQFDRV